MKKIILPVMVFFCILFVQVTMAQQMSEDLRTQLWQTPNVMRMSFNLGYDIYAIDVRRMMVVFRDSYGSRQLPTEYFEAPVVLNGNIRTKLIIRQELNGVYRASMYLPHKALTLQGVVTPVMTYDYRRQYVMWWPDINSNYYKRMQEQLNFWAREDNIEIARFDHTFVNVSRNARMHMANMGVAIRAQQNQLWLDFRGRPLQLLSNNLSNNQRVLVSVGYEGILFIALLDEYGRRNTVVVNPRTGQVVR